MNNKKIKIIIASNKMGIGGAERTVQTIALHLNRDLFDISVLCLESGGERVRALEEQGVSVLIGNGTIEKIKELVEPGTVDILHFHRSGHTEPLHNAVIEYIRPQKLMETNVFAFDDPTLASTFDLHIYKSIMMLTQRVWKGHLPSDPEQPWLRERVIYNPVTTEMFDQYCLNENERLQKRAVLGIQPSDIVLGRIGRNDPVKWGDLILSAIPYSIEQFPEIKWVFRTVPTSRLAWLKKKGYLGKYVFVLPETQDEQVLAETYQLLDIYVHTSRRGEAFGNALNEAMAWSLPIIVENTPYWDNGQLEQVVHGKSGWVIQSITGLMGAIQDLVHNSAKRQLFGQAGHTHVTETFGMRQGVKQYELAYSQLSGLMTPDKVREKMFPSEFAITQYIKEYPKYAMLDFPSEKKPWWPEMKHFILKWTWRIHDSAKARGWIT